MSNAAMDTRSMTFVTIGNLVSPSSSVNWNPLFDFPDHWQPRFSAQFPLPGTSEGENWPAPSERKISPVLAARENRAVKPWDPLLTHRRGVNETRYERLGRPSVSLVPRQGPRSAPFRVLTHPPHPFPVRLRLEDPA